MSHAEREKWNEIYAHRGRRTAEPARFVEEAAPLLPASGRALDVAGGAGRHGLWLARRGFEVTICDISECGLELAGEAARAEDLAVALARRDLDVEPLPRGSFDVVVCVHYLARSLLSPMAEALAPGGVLLFVHPTRRNLERHARPGPRYLLDQGEIGSLLSAVRPALDVLRIEEDWGPEGRHEARVVARRR